MKKSVEHHPHELVRLIRSHVVGKSPTKAVDACELRGVAQTRPTSRRGFFDIQKFPVERIFCLGSSLPCVQKQIKNTYVVASSVCCSHVKHCDEEKNMKLRKNMDRTLRQKFANSLINQKKTCIPLIFDLPHESPGMSLNVIVQHNLTSTTSQVHTTCRVNNRRIFHLCFLCV